MNQKVIVVFVLTIIALIVLYLYSFGPLAGTRSYVRANPSSLKPAASEQVTVNSEQPIVPSAGANQTMVASPAPATPGKKDVAFNVYQNKDKKENFYAVSIPQEWQVHAGSKAGGYVLTFSGGNGSIQLMDVPDNTTLELYVLSREEPRLKKSQAHYERVDYRKETLHGQEAHQLVYQSKNGEEINQTFATYIVGSDEALVISLTARPGQWDSLRGLFESVANSFRWESK
jgi:hypothetical protein